MEIVAQFSDGRLLVNEEKAVEQGYKMSGYSTYGVPYRIPNIKQIDKVVSLDANISGLYGLAGKLDAQIAEAGVSGDTLLVVLRRADNPLLASGAYSGFPAFGSFAGITSGIAIGNELASGTTGISGLVRITANVIGY
jgi:hypothetical protein